MGWIKAIYPIGLRLPFHGVTWRCASSFEESN